MNNGSGNCDSCFIEVRDVTKTFGCFMALDDVSLRMDRGEFVSILGPSGCGKTTLLRVIAGMEEQNTGSIFLEGKDISRLPTSKRNCSIVFQSYALFPNLSAAQNVAYGINTRGMGKKDVTKKVEKLLELVGLQGIGPKYPAQLSGGQQQRVALARALATSPSLLLMDEPLSALDAQVRVRLRSEIRSLQQRLNLTTIMVTHDQEEALTMADRILIITEGKLKQYATPQEIYKSPSDPFVAGFIGSMNFIPYWVVDRPGRVRHGRLELDACSDKTRKLLGAEVTVGIRPEDIRVINGEKIDRNVLRTKFESVEFRGSSYRLRLRLKEDSPCTEPIFLDVDIRADELQKTNIFEKNEVPVHFPSDRLLMFEHGSSEVSQLTGAV